MQGTRSDQENEEGERSWGLLLSVLLLLPTGLNVVICQEEVEESLPWEVKQSGESSLASSPCASALA